MDAYQIGEKEYSLEELQKLIDKGSYAIEMESKFNTPFESAWSAYGRTQNENRELREQLEAAKAQPQEVEKPEQTPNFDEILAQKGYLSREDAEKLVEEKITLKQQVEQIAGTMKSLEGKLDGSDGRPKFEINDMLTYMQENSMTDPEKAYNYRYSDEIATWKADKAGTKPEFAPSNTGDTNASKSPAAVAFNRDNVDAALREALSESGGKI